MTYSEPISTPASLGRRLALKFRAHEWRTDLWYWFGVAVGFAIGKWLA